MPVVAQETGKLCARLRRRGEPPKGTQVRRAGPVDVRVPKRIGLRASFWNTSRVAQRIAVRAENLDTAERISCAEGILKPGQGGTLDLRRVLDLRDNSTVGVRMYVLPEVGDEVVKKPGKRMLGSLVMHSAETNQPMLKWDFE